MVGVTSASRKCYFVYDIPEAYGKRFRVWSGRLETGPFTISYGRIHLSSEEDSESKTTQGLARPPITLGATLKEILKRYGEPAWWRELIYPQRIIGTYRDEDFDFQFEFFTNNTEKPVLGKISYIVPDSELTEALIQQVLKNHSSGHEWIKGPSGHKYRRDGARATLNSNTISVTSDEYTTFREEGSEETLRSWRIPPSQIQSQEYGIYPPLYRMQKSRIEKRMDEARKRREKQRKEEAN